MRKYDDERLGCEQDEKKKIVSVFYLESLFKLIQ